MLLTDAFGLLRHFHQAELSKDPALEGRCIDNDVDKKTRTFAEDIEAINNAYLRSEAEIELETLCSRVLNFKE